MNAELTLTAGARGCPMGFVSRQFARSRRSTPRPSTDIPETLAASPTEDALLIEDASCPVTALFSGALLVLLFPWR